MAGLSRFIPRGLGWQRDLPDPRDFTPQHPQIAALLDKLPAPDIPPPLRIDLREDAEGLYCSPPDDQGCLNSSSVFACLSLIEYFERKTLGRTFEGSPMFLYEMARKMADDTGNASIGIRATFKALCRFGSPPEEMRTYTDMPSDESPQDIALLGFTHDLDGMIYFRLDTPGQSGRDLLAIVKSFLAAQFPVVMGFAVPRSLNSDSIIPFRPVFDSYRGGQSVIAVGYDDQRLAGKQGALLVRNSWGTDWGDAGYGWLPYPLITQHQAADLWTAFREPWATTQSIYKPGEFEAPGEAEGHNP